MNAKNQRKIETRPVTAALLVLAALGAALAIAAPAAATSSLDSRAGDGCIGHSTDTYCYGVHVSARTCTGIHVDNHCVGVQTGP